MMLNKELVEQILVQSLQWLYAIDETNIKYEVSERNICARLAHHMENIMREYDQQNNSHYFQNYYVDVEYNRMGFGDLKHFEDYKHVSHYMVSDLLIHSRGYERNLLAVEMKKPRNRKTVEEDKIGFMSFSVLLGLLVYAMVCRSPMPNNRVLCFLGKYSYEIYLIYGAIISVLFGRAYTYIADWWTVFILLTLLSSFAAAVILRKVVFCIHL